MGVPVFIALVFALAGVGVFAANKVHAKRVGAHDEPFLLEAYREIDAMGLNGPPLAPPRQLGEIQDDLAALKSMAERDPLGRTTVYDSTAAADLKWRAMLTRMQAPHQAADHVDAWIAIAAVIPGPGERQPEAAPSYPARAKS